MSELLPENKDSSGTIERVDSSDAASIVASIEALPPEMKNVVSIVAGMFRSSTGPDPETARVLVQSEMHAENCKLEGFKEALKVRDLQAARDHLFRTKKLNHTSAQTFLISIVCIAGIISGLYLTVVKQNGSVGNVILIASFTALLGGKSLVGKDKD